MKKIIKLGFLILIIFIVFGCKESVEKISSDQEGFWPTNGWLSSTPEAQGMDSDSLIAMLENIKQDPYANKMINDGRSIDSITIIRNGTMVLDGYLYPYDKNIKHIIHSCTKSIVSTLIGVAIDKGYIKDIDQPLFSFFPEYNTAGLDQKKTAITLKHLLTMSSGLETKDSYIYQWKGIGEMINSPDWVQHVIDRPLIAEPGQKFEYSNMSSYLLTAILQKTTQMTAMDFARTYLFDPLGIADVGWKTDPNGIYTGWGNMMLNPHDMAKIGFLYLNEGEWNGKQIVSKSWVTESTKKHLNATLFGGYGFQWWVEPDRYFVAAGYQGQFIFVIPKKNMVVAFTGNLISKDFFIPKNLVDKYIVPAVVSNKPLPPDLEKKEKLDGHIAYFKNETDRRLIWNSVGQAVAENGLFTHKESPAFSFKYPEASVKRKMRYPDQVMSMRTFDRGTFSAFVTQRPYGVRLENAAPYLIAHELRQNGSDVNIVSNQPVVLSDGTKSYRTDIDWKFNSTWPTRSSYLSVFKDDKWIFLTYSFDVTNTVSIPEHQKVTNSLFATFHFQQPVD